LIAQLRYDLMNTEQWNRLDHWLKMLPPETVEKTPILLITRAFIYERRSQIVESFADRDRAESLLSALQPESPEQKEVKGMIAVLHGAQHILSGEGDRAIESAERALRLLPAEALHIRSYAIAEQVLAYQMAGDIGAGLKIINEILNARALLPGITQARMMLWFCIAYWMEGDLNGLKQPALQCLKLGEQHALPESISFGRYFLGVLHYVRNELSEAERYLAAVVDDPFTVRPQYLVQSAFALARIYTPHGRDDEASNVIESVISRVMETNDTLALAVARAFQVELALRQRKIPEAQRLNEHAAYDLLPPVWFFYVPQLTSVKLLLAQNTSDSLEKAFTLLDQIDGFVSKTNRKTIRIDVLALQALILDAQGKEPAAMERLTESLVLARPGGFIRNFVDMGPPMVDLLKRMHRQNVAVDYIENLLAAFSDDEQVVAPESESADHPVASPYQPLRPSTPSQPLLEPLTNRELDVLELLAQRLQNKEIADKLSVSTETVKAHLSNIYQKLNVSKRREAVEKAKKLGIL
jgi:LuxR family maltose regulon positive regulatory protein